MGCERIQKSLGFNREEVAVIINMSRHNLVIAIMKVNTLWELQSASGEELSALTPSILDKAFRGEL